MSALRTNAVALVAVLRAQLIASAQYRVSALVWTLGSAIQMVVALAVWSAVADASPGGQVRGLDAGAFGAYFVALLLVRQLVLTSLPYKLPEDIRIGKLAVYAVRPAHPLTALVGNELAFKVQHVLIGGVVAVALAFTIGVQLGCSVGDVAALMALLPLAMLAMHMVDGIFGSLGFWLVRVDGLRGMYLLGEVVLGGMLAPLAVFPPWFRTVAELLPFWWAFGYPAQLLAEGSSAGTTSSPLHAIAVLGAWSIVGWLVLRWVWARGSARDGAVGT